MVTKGRENDGPTGKVDIRVTKVRFRDPIKEALNKIADVFSQLLETSAVTRRPICP